MRIHFDILRDGLNAINTAADRLASAQWQMSTGRRVNRVGDDPLAAQQAVGEHAGLRAVDAYARTLDSAAARLGIMESALSAIEDKLGAVIVHGTGARGSSSTQESRDAAAAAVRGLRDSLASDINGSFNGTYLFSGTESGTPAYAQVAGVWTYQGNATTMQLEVDEGRMVAVTANGQSIAQGTDAVNIFAALESLAVAIETGDDAGMAAGIAAAERAHDRTLRAHGRLGADERGLDDAAVSLSAKALAGETRRSRLEDANMAEAITRLSQAETTYQAALAAVSTAERTTLLDYLR